jgi:4-amino-4-deoxy-L-arabinose transferase-like glycosyltransferase
LENSSQPGIRTSAITAACGAAIALVALFCHLGAIGLVGPDEPRYGWIARAMAASGDWVTPRLYGQPWFEKPVLYYWAGAIGFLMHLPPEWALRLPSALAALAATLAIGWLAWKHHDARLEKLEDSAVLAPLIFATTVAAIGFSRAATPDMLFSASIALAMASAATVFRYAGSLRAASTRMDPARAPALPFLLFGAFIGLGVLAKGPAAVLLAGGAVGLWALLTGNLRGALRLAHPYALATFCIVALPWYVICAFRNPGFLRVFLLQHNFERYLTPVFQHRQPFWFFGPITLLAVLPWTALLWPAGREGLRLWKEKSWHKSPGFFFACWAIFPVLFFSLSQSKLPSYILPAIAPLALVMAAAVKRSDVSAQSNWPGMAVGATWVALGAAALAWTHRLPAATREALSSSIFLPSILAIAGGAGVIFLAQRRRGAFIALSLVLAAVLVEFAGLTILPGLDPFVSARWHAQLMRGNLHPDRIFAYNLPRAWMYGLAFYFGRELPVWSPSDPEPALVLTTPAGLEEVRNAGRFYGNLEETYQGILYVPIAPAPRK